MGMNRAVMEFMGCIPSNMALRAACAALRRRVAAAFFAAARRRIVPSAVAICAARAALAVADVKECLGASITVKPMSSAHAAHRKPSSVVIPRRVFLHGLHHFGVGSRVCVVIIGAGRPSLYEPADFQYRFCNW